MTEIIAAFIIAFSVALANIHQTRNLLRMSQSFDNLTAAVNDLRAKADVAIALLKNPPTGTPDAALDALTTQVQGVASDLAAATPPPAA